MEGSWAEGLPPDEHPVDWLLPKVNMLVLVMQVLEPVQQARLMVAAYPFALDLLAICSIIADSGHSLGMLNGSLALLSQLPQDSPFQALTPNQVPPRS